MTTTVRNIAHGGYDALNPDHVYIGRANRRGGLPASKWANPIAMPSESERHHVIAGYRAYLLRRDDLVAALPELRGKTLYCWCAPKACHGDVLAEFADGGTV